MSDSNSHLIGRPSYLERLRRRRGNGMVKVIMGPRRCGKSTLLRLFQEELRKEGVSKERLIAFNLEDLDSAPLRNASALHDAVLKLARSEKTHYVFIDEIQLCTGLEEAVDSLLLRENIDLYITGSNAYMLSGELATLLTGRHMPLEMMPLSFAEYHSGVVSEGLSPEEDFQHYLRNGSFPALLKYRHDETYVSDYYLMLQTP